MAFYSLILSIIFLSGAFSNLVSERSDEELVASEDQSLASFFDFWIPRMRMRGRRSVDMRGSDLKQETENNEKRFWNANQKDMLSFLDAYKQRDDDRNKRFWNANQKDMMTLLDMYKQESDGKIKRFWNANQKDLMSFLDAYKGGYQ